MSDQELLEYKNWGHQLFQLECERRKIRKNELYHILQKKFGHNCHFARMDEKQTRQVINQLLRWLKKKPVASIKFNPLSKSHLKSVEFAEIKKANKKVPFSEIQAAVKKLPKRKIPWWKRILRYFK